MQRRSVLTSLAAFAVGSIFSFVGCTPPSWVIEAENIAQLSLPIIAGIAAITGIGAPVSAATTAIALLIKLFQQYQQAPAQDTLAQIQAALATANSNIRAILGASHISNPDTTKKIAAILQLVTDEFTQIAQLVRSGGTTVTMKVNQQPIKVDHKAFKKRYNALVAQKTGDPQTDSQPWYKAD